MFLDDLKNLARPRSNFIQTYNVYLFKKFIIKKKNIKKKL